ncbi:MAG: SUF system NifU family Fe-S cluster assembly protein [Anaerolineae bacterium]|nr:SUF system NifU family Fe-S cluster assembly protein [Anaerolineae bacterium]
MSDLYREYMLEHYHNPQNYGVLEGAAVDIHLDNPTCGDKVHITAQMDEDGHLTKVMFEGHGCVVSMAAASMLTEEVIGKSAAEIESMDLENIQEMMGGVKLSMGRIKCAMLALNALKRGLEDSD